MKTAVFSSCKVYENMTITVTGKLYNLDIVEGFAIKMEIPESVKKAAEAKKLDEVLEANRQLVKAYKVLKNQYNDIVDIANERIKLANSVYKEEVEKNEK